MSVQKSRKFCTYCNEYRLAERQGTNHILHLLLTLLTCGLWLIVWLGQSIKFGGWKCPVCGSNVK